MAQHPNSGKKAAPKTAKSTKRQTAVTPEPSQTRKTGPSGLHNISAEPETTD